MSSNIKVNRICKHCNQEFIAKTTVTKYCSHKCASAAYKARTRNTKIEECITTASAIKQTPNIDINTKDFLSISETSTLLGISKRTLYRMFERNQIPVIKIGNRTIIRRKDLDTYLVPLPIENLEYKIKDCYKTSEILTIYNISEKAIYELIKRNNIPKIKKGLYSYVPKELIDNLLK